MDETIFGHLACGVHFCVTDQQSRDAVDEQLKAQKPERSRVAA